MSSKSSASCAGLGEFDNNNDDVCLRTKNLAQTTGGAFWKKKTSGCNHCGGKKPVNAVAAVRKEEVLAIRNRFPTKIPIIVQRYSKERSLPQMKKNRFLVPQEITVSQFQTVMRNRIKLNPNQAIYLLIDNKTMMSLSLTLAEVYTLHANCDGYLYITYASQDVFGNETAHKNCNNKKKCKRNFLMQDAGL